MNNKKQQKSIYITTAIAYLNGPPHMGHALEIIQADCLARYYRLIYPSLVFQTGSDEHGAKIYNTALEKNMEVKKFIDMNYEIFKKLYYDLHISYDKYVRTTDEKHMKGAQKLWSTMFEKGDLYKSHYTGLYCIGCESYKTESELENGLCPFHPNRKLVELKEENYFFKLTKYIDKLIDIYQKDEIKIIPENRKAEIMAILKSGIQDISFSRQKEKMPWGIPIPNDDEHVMYVWCDALSNYITNVGYEYDPDEFKRTWPANIHLIGKDITKFHAIYWPAMLLSAGIDLYKNLFVHGFLTIEGNKMGKSLGNASDPFYLIEQYGADPLRYYLLKNVSSAGDGSFKESDLVEIYNSSLADDLGNLVSRVLTFIEKDFKGKIPKLNKLEKIDKEFLNKFEFKDELKEYFDTFQLNKAVDRVWRFISESNKYVNDTKPWELKKKGDLERYSTVLYILLEALRVISILVSPFIPETAERLTAIMMPDYYDSIKEFDDSRPYMKVKFSMEDVVFKTDRDGRVGKKVILFPKKSAVEKDDPLQIYDFKLGKIVYIEDHPESPDIYVITMDLGSKQPTICAKIAKYYKKEELLDKKFVVLSNIKARDVKGIISEAMFIGGLNPETKKIELATADGEPGAQIFIGELQPKPADVVSGKKISKLKMKALKNGVVIGGKPLKSEEGPVKINLPDGVKLQ